MNLVNLKDCILKNRRQHELNLQAVQLLNGERIKLEEQFVLQRMRKRLEDKIKDEFDSELSRKIDAIILLME